MPVRYHDPLTEYKLSHRYTIYSNNPEDFLGASFYDWRKYVFLGLRDYLCSHGLDVRHEHRESFEVILKHSKTKDVAIRDSLAVMQNDQTRDYFVLDCHDMVKTRELLLFVRDHRCKRVLKCQYRSKVFKEGDYQKVRPWTYFDRYWPKNEKSLIESRGIPRTSNSLYFRGADWAKRDRILEELSRKGVISSDFQIIDFDDYFRETLEHRVILSLPGMADICNRDIEGFGSGTCVLRPTVETEFHNELIPDYHYISVDTKIRKNDPIEVADKIEQRFREIIDDHSYIASVVRNAANWYDENVRRDAAMKLTAELLGFE